MYTFTKWYTTGNCLADVYTLIGHWEVGIAGSKVKVLCLEGK